MLCFLSGCTKQTRKTKESYVDQHEFQARCVDIPFPLDIKIKNKGIISNGEHDAQFFVVYTTHLSVSQLQKLYAAEMEFIGWREQANFTQQDNEVVLIFERPEKLVVVIISNIGKQRHVRCYIKN